ncbi:hypothetical protein [Streptomyces griseosporeus]|uniref:hypothetical protein n=1 Tax=Streptomyces griseosporeus TaxID=1910 RepID=UPI00167E0E83|nr:hypothetical protein [Streptomyces griseosporeus]GHF59952.1 hypothetical protein GCM10018783_31020 [Streptomyces griseosporeus]
MLALRLTRSARPAVQLRRLLVATASAGTGFLFLCVLGYAIGHPGASAGSLLLRLAWCAVPLAATVYFALAVARTDPATRPRPGLSAIGLGPARLMAVSAVTTALSTVLGSMLALLVFLHLRGDLTGMPFDGAASAFLAADASLPLPAALTLLAVVPVTTSAAVAVALRPKDPHRPARPRAYGRFGAYGRTAARETFGAYGRFGARWSRPGRTTALATATASVGTARESAQDAGQPPQDGTALTAGPTPRTEVPSAPAPPAPAPAPAPAPESTTHPAAPPADGTPEPPPNPTATLPWGITTLAAGLAVEAYATRGTTPTTLHLPGGMGSGPAAVLVGWVLTAIGLALAGPGLTHLCGRLLQAARPGALRLLAGRVLMAEATRIGRPLGIVCAVASAAYALPTLRPDGDLGPLTTLGGLLVAGCTVATLLTAAVEARQLRADTTAALLRLGAPAGMLRSAAALRAAALLAVFGPLTLVVAELAALPLAR